MAITVLNGKEGRVLLSAGLEKDAEGAAASIMYLSCSLVHSAFNSITWMCLARRPGATGPRSPDWLAKEELGTTTREEDSDDPHRLSHHRMKTAGNTKLRVFYLLFSK